MIVAFQMSGRPNLPRCAQALLSITTRLHSIKLWLDCWDSHMQASRHEYVVVVRIRVPPATSRERECSRQLEPLGPSVARSFAFHTSTHHAALVLVRTCCTHTSLLVDLDSVFTVVRISLLVLGVLCCDVCVVARYPNEVKRFMHKCQCGMQIFNPCSSHAFNLKSPEDSATSLVAALKFEGLFSLSFWPSAQVSGNTNER